jgi:hypothetical protein
MYTKKYSNRMPKAIYEDLSDEAKAFLKRQARARAKKAKESASMKKMAKMVSSMVKMTKTRKRY